MEPWRRSTQVSTTARFMANMATAKPMATNLMAKIAMSFISLASRRGRRGGRRRGGARALAGAAQLRRLLPRQADVQQLRQLLHPAERRARLTLRVDGAIALLVGAGAVDE